LAFAGESFQQGFIAGITSRDLLGAGPGVWAAKRRAAEDSSRVINSYF
jgi:hypothetical protein